MLSVNDIKEELSHAYIHAVASRAGFGCDRPGKDRDSVDAVISARGRLASDSKIISPRIELQLKATAVSSIPAEDFPFTLSLKNFNDLRAETMAPRLLVVYIMPEDENDWLITNEQQLIARRCCYWSNLKGYPESSNETTQTVRISRKEPVFT